MCVTCEAPAGSPEGTSEPCLSHTHASLTPNPAQQKHYTPHCSKAPLTAIHHSLKLSKCGRKGKIWDKRGVKADSEIVCKGGGPWSCRRTQFLLIDESPGHDGIQMWQFGDIKGANSSASPAAVQLGTKWSLSHCILLRCSLWFRICSIIFSSWAKADRRVGRCVLSIPFTSPTGGLESEGGIDWRSAPEILTALPFHASWTEERWKSKWSPLEMEQRDHRWPQYITVPKRGHHLSELYQWL